MLIGKSTMIQRKYFKEYNVDMNIFNTLTQYAKRNIFYATVNDIKEKINENTGEYIDTIAEISLYPEIGGVNRLDVPIVYVF